MKNFLHFIKPDSRVRLAYILKRNIFNIRKMEETKKTLILFDVDQTLTPAR